MDSFVRFFFFEALDPLDAANVGDLARWAEAPREIVYGAGLPDGLLAEGGRT
jgi:hypothetical protein